MKALSLQLQPALSPDLDMADAVARLMQIAERLGAKTRLTEGIDDGHYVNLDFTPPDTGLLWLAIRDELQTADNLACATIVCCEGERGWDDFLLLHHFDSSEPLDTFA